jgi:alanine racemase
MLPPGVTENALPPGTTGVIAVDLGALRRNYRRLKALASPSETAAVVKANGYGLGADRVAAALIEEGCTTFFVATLAEGQALRSAHPSIMIYVLDGLLPNTADTFNEAGLRPVLNNREEIADWLTARGHLANAAVAAVHIDTGMTRLGLPLAEALEYRREIGLVSRDDHPLPLLTHFACADVPEHPKNREQMQAFTHFAAQFTGMQTSMANSGGIFLGREFHGNMVRPGIALYGGQAQEGRANGMEHVASLYGRIVQVREAERGKTVGYGAGQALTRRTRIATVSLGYADGLFRSVSASDLRDGLRGFIGDYAIPLLGRVSMDLTMFDITDVPDGLVRRGGWIELLGQPQTVDDVARLAGTIGYEVLTSLSRRIPRVYLDG